MDLRAIKPPDPPEDMPPYGGWESDGTTRSLDHLIAAAVLAVMGLIAIVIQ